MACFCSSSELSLCNLFVFRSYTEKRKMSMDITFLGTGSAYPSPTRGASATVIRNEGECWLFDCGEGTQTQFMKSHLKAGLGNLQVWFLRRLSHNLSAISSVFKLIFSGDM